MDDDWGYPPIQETYGNLYLWGKNQWIITSIAGFSDVNRIVTRWCAAVSWMKKPHVNFGYNYVQFP